MAFEQSMTLVITQAVFEAAKAAKMAVLEAEILASRSRPIQATLRMSGPTLKQAMFDRKDPDKFHKLCNFKIDVKFIF